MHEIGIPLSYDVCFVELSIRVLPQFAIAQRQITTPTTVSRHLKSTVNVECTIHVSGWRLVSGAVRAGGTVCWYKRNGTALTLAAWAHVNLRTHPTSLVWPTLPTSPTSDSLCLSPAHTRALPLTHMYMYAHARTHPQRVFSVPHMYMYYIRIRI